MACLNKFTKKPEWTSMQKMVHRRLVRECSSKRRRSSNLTATLRTALERLKPGARSAVLAHEKGGCAPLFLACMRGKFAIVQYLVRVCGADVEQRGLYSYIERGEGNVTPLWFAAAAGYLHVVKVLADAGADLNYVSDSGLTPVLVACFTMKANVVRFLARRGADIHRPSYKGSTCLMKSVYDKDLCEFLILRGADVNACNSIGETALHQSIKRKNMESMRLLLQHGVDPHVTTRKSNDALQLACLLGLDQMVDELTQTVCYSPERLADTHDLLAAELVVNFVNREQEALSHWRTALALREKHTLPKRPEMAPRDTFQFTREFRNEAELAAAEADGQALHTQALLVFERVLSETHFHLVEHLLQGYAENLSYQRTVDLWLWALEIILRDSVMEVHLCHVIFKMMILFLNKLRMTSPNDGVLRFRDVFRMFSLLLDSLPSLRRTVDVQPIYIDRALEFDCIMSWVTQLLHILISLVDEKQEKEKKICALLLHEKLCWLVAQDVRSVMLEESLLHLCVLKYIPSADYEEPYEAAATGLFPSLPCVRALLAAGASVNSTDSTGSSPLLVAARPENFCSDIVQELLETGALLDQRNGLGDTPFSLLSSNNSSHVPLMRHRTLESLAASTIVSHHLEVQLLPKTVQRFVELHRGSFRDRGLYKYIKRQTKVKEPVHLIVHIYI